MNSTRSGRLAPALVVAILALGACVAGIAVADPAATTSKVTKKKVKKISGKVANRQITARAPGLTVGNSEKVDGLDAVQISPGTSVDTAGLPDQDLTNTLAVVLTTTITTAGGDSRVLATAAVEVDSAGGNDDNVVCRITIAGSESPTYLTDIPDADVDRQSLALVYGHVVPPGTHAVELLCRDNGGDSEIEQAGLNASAHLTG
jgi:hypothetical protein